MFGDNNPSRDLVSFGPFRLIAAERLLEKSGEPVHLGARALDILIALVDRASEAVSKRDLMTQVWPDVTVDEGSLRFHIAAMRKALGDGQPGARYVTTLPGRGYCFVAPVSRSETSRPPAPAEPAPARPATNLPRCLSAVIGRAVEMSELRESLGRNRLVTLAGPGGIGKTRLAIELGWHVMGLFPDGVWLIDLAPLTDPAVVTSATATVLGVALKNPDTAVETIAVAIDRRRLLLIFDNCEYLVGAAAELIEALLARVSGLSVLATSQENLHIPAEQIYRLNPLALPPGDAVDPQTSAGRITGFGAIDLFVERACAADRRFGLDDGNAACVAEICRQLDGIPLALEMAAARLPLLGIEGLRAGLGERLQMLKAGPRTGETRHHTLRAMLEWSHGRLGAADQRVFRRLAVFAGGFSLDAAIGVAGRDADRWDTVDALGRLIDKSLLTAEGGEPPRYRLLETLRMYATEQLRASGEDEIIAEHHARYFAELFDQAYESGDATPDTEWLGSYRLEIDNVRAALDWALAGAGRGQIAVVLSGAAARLWYMLALFGEGRRYVDRAIGLIDRDTPLAVAARLLRRAGNLWYNSDRLRALALLERSAAIYRQLADPSKLAPVLGVIGILHTLLGRNASAKAALREAQEILSGSDDKKSLYSIMQNLGIIALNMNETDEARRYYGRALDLARALKDIPRETRVLLNLAEVEFAFGSLDLAVELSREAVNGLRSASTQSPLGFALCNLGSYLIAQGNAAEARPAAEEALSLVREEGGYVVCICLQQWALLGALEGRHKEAARLIGFVDAGYASSGEIRQPTERQISDRLSALLETALPSTDIRSCAAEGAHWSEARAVDFTFDRLILPGRPAAGRPGNAFRGRGPRGSDDPPVSGRIGPNGTSARRL
jgi:predicted ATPase/DNA-binding winged helix-turn-helix (wHTH) protein